MDLDLPIDFTIDYHEDGININHFICKDEGEGYAREGLEKIVRKAQDNGYEYVVINMGNKGQRDSAEFLSQLGFNIVESHKDHVTAELELVEPIEILS